mgnify:CR=1 FL=1
MRARLLLLLVTLLLVGGNVLQYRSGLQIRADRQFLVKRIELLEQENERLRAALAEGEKEKKAHQLAVQRTAIEEKTVAIRGLEFREPVQYATVKRSEVADVLLRKIAEQYTDEELHHAQIGFAALGLLPENYSLKEALITLLEEQVAAFYDQTGHKLYMYEGSSLNNAQQRVVLSHELVHALQDQHFNLQAILGDVKANDDRSTAVSSLLEGDATVTMNLFLMREASLKSLTQFVGAFFTQSMEKLTKAPRFLRESLLFPYLEGSKFCTYLYEQGGFDAINRAYRRLPGSTAEILHPELYVKGFQPRTYDWPRTPTLGEKPLVDNVVGELGIRILLAEWVNEADAPELAEGWQGDRYRVFANGDALVWRVAWRNPAKADAFQKAMETLLAKRYPKKGERVLKLLRPTPEEVVLVNTKDARWANALENEFAR